MSDLVPTSSPPRPGRGELTSSLVPPFRGRGRGLTREQEEGAQPRPASAYWWLDAERARLEVDGWRTPSVWAQLDPPDPSEYAEDYR